MFIPNEQEFIKSTKKGNLIPVYKEILADLETPVSAYFRLADKSDYSFLLESVEGEERIAQYSFLAKNPELIFESKNNKITITRLKRGRPKKEIIKTRENPLRHIREILKKYKFVNTPGLPRFCGGLVGYFSYDIVRFFEKLPNKTKDDLKVPDTLLILAKDLIIFDHRNHKIKVVSCVEIDPDSPLKAKKTRYQQAQKRIDQLISELNSPISITKNRDRRKQKKLVQSRFTSNLTEANFKKMVSKAKAKIRAGEIIQVVLSQRFECDLKTDPFNVYRMLRVLNPSPYMYFLNYKGVKIIGSSPELLVRAEDGVVDTRPIAGTRPRGRDDKHDSRLAADLLKDPKERAEHIMLVDLGRNDLGRVCQKGSVHLTEFMIIEKYSHVMHIVSNVRGKLQKKYDNLDVVQAAFPAGTLSGAPKIRAMEIIEELERQRRGPYGGCIGYFDFSGNLDSCITIRTIVVKGKKAYVQAGAGIVADSNPKKEFEETVNKAKAQMRAIELANQQS